LIWHEKGLNDLLTPNSACSPVGPLATPNAYKGHRLRKVAFISSHGEAVSTSARNLDSGGQFELIRELA